MADGAAHSDGLRPFFSRRHVDGGSSTYRINTCQAGGRAMLMLALTAGGHCCPILLIRGAPFFFFFLLLFLFFPPPPSPVFGLEVGTPRCPARSVLTQPSQRRDLQVNQAPRRADEDRSRRVTDRRGRMATNLSACVLVGREDEMSSCPGSNHPCTDTRQQQVWAAIHRGVHAHPSQPAGRSAQIVRQATTTTPMILSSSERHYCYYYHRCITTEGWSRTVPRSSRR